MTQQPHVVYILHFKFAYWRYARHYIGYTKFTADERANSHRNGTGSKLVNYAVNHGNEFTISYTKSFPSKYEARQHEIRLKREKHLSRHCLLCHPHEGGSK